MRAHQRKPRADPDKALGVVQCARCLQTWPCEVATLKDLLAQRKAALARAVDRLRALAADESLLAKQAESRIERARHETAVATYALVLGLLEEVS